MWFLVVLAILCYCYLFPVCISAVLKSFLPKVSQDTVGFFHPFTQDGGGGERVLWCAVRALMQRMQHAKFVVYTGGPEAETSSKVLRARAKERFGIELPRDIRVVHLKKTRLVLDSTWPRFTLLGQAVGGVMVTWEALRACVPGLFLDTAGYAFGYPLPSLAGAFTAAYVHYPYVSTDMLSRVRAGQVMYNNAPHLAQSRSRTFLKILYYRAIALAYRVCGRYAQVVMVNSSWTGEHIRSLWRPFPFTPFHSQPFMATVFPPCDTLALQDLPIVGRPLSPAILVSVAQFRPEKQHMLQLQALALARTCARGGAGGTLSEALVRRVLQARLVIVGGCRGEEDRKRLNDLKFQALKMDLGPEVVTFFEGLPHSELRVLLGQAVAGIHTMLDEHFGISIVEYMAAGVVPIVHKSGGPKADIVINLPQSRATGRLAGTVGEYAAAILEILSMSEESRQELAGAAREQASKFSERNFEEAFCTALDSAIQAVNTMALP
mmetsp:Transcript_5522/g.7465  ORF Transcript_5522/g.7465 Transcript_5522/m.7465 type:complete len:493 (-) Transcript_5522:69-1547(-)|eukprot:CAMPEP_0196578046 /NCGR_PEP_ID=MMETSP1081-20130531/7021_1 /TAXON_ID=36882 /ORGANISM="Pyramimonas amylifera, Strain CCMP720" /LENGTH=492 /DNA_ID=CAMNT_0041897151 /DNA_START=71 /DNA_END=1549 /DNA_ORIENTATION=+